MMAAGAVGRGLIRDLLTASAVIMDCAVADSHEQEH